MGRLIMVTGGARSGKSSYAEELAAEGRPPVAYLATAVPFDEGMRDRIKHHRASRDPRWTTYEIPTGIEAHINAIDREHATLLIDCMTVYLNNLFFEDPTFDWESAPRERIDEKEAAIHGKIEGLLTGLAASSLDVVLVTNEVGMGIVPDNRLTRVYRDIAGRVNQRMARAADRVVLVVSGIPVTIKGEDR